MSDGIVVRHKELGSVYAVKPENRDPATEEKLRDLHPWETRLSFPVKQSKNFKKGKNNGSHPLEPRDNR